MIPINERVMTWLRDGVPLALLVDLAAVDGPRSREILTAEAVADDVRRAEETAARTAPATPAGDFSADAAAC